MITTPNCHDFFIQRTSFRLLQFIPLQQMRHLPFAIQSQPQIIGSRRIRRCPSVSFGLRGGAEDAEDSIEIVIKRHIVITETLPEKSRCEIEEFSFVSLAIGILEFVSARV